MFVLVCGGKCVCGQLQNLVTEGWEELHNSKGKAVQQHTYWGEGGRMYSSYSFTTSALDAVSGQRHVPATLYPWGKDPW
jgi:uncharacterized 2Fe-2S/4Fe-4S cluster protein (DUF4445 family)